jgi:uncharacterized 2Fe-2S/4Fe-4S cluster protein (DUF4445 family)
MYRVFFVKEKKSVQVPPDTTILEAERLAQLVPDAPCGGAGKCGKCLVKADGVTVKACQTTVTHDIEIETTETKRSYTILTEGSAQETVFAPDLQMHRISLAKAVLGDNRSDWERMLASLHLAGGPDPQQVAVNLPIASSLYEKAKEAQQWYVIHTGHEILELRREEGQRYFAAVDIGTTTVAAYLMDGADGHIAAVESCLNPQAQYGADVIMRSNYALEHGTEELSGCIRAKINELLGKLAAKAGAKRQDIFQVSIVGNTCMHHLFLGISPASLTHAPYTPAICQRMTLRAASFDIQIHPNGQLLMLPDIAGYVGADTVGCVLAVRPDQKEEITLLVDIGTNGEMVLGNRDRLVACSTAAGPAFEGAKITCGMRGSAGAVDHVSFENGRWSYTTVQGAPAVGLCGSGLIDLVAQLILAGCIDESGHLESGQADAQTFVLVPPEEAGNDTGVYLTQKDIREVQLAKAAIAAGQKLLMKELSVTEDDIAGIYIAGAFGNYMDPVSAGVIGMLPKRLTGRIHPIGNAAGEGARIALLDGEAFEESERLARRIDFVELAASPEFQDYFVDELGFDEEEESL